MEQEIYDDPHGLAAWDQRHASRCFVAIANSQQWNAITGEPAPTTPPTAAEYTNAGLPWFDYYGSDTSALGGSGILNKLSSVKQLGANKSQKPLPENESVKVEHLIGIRANGSQEVREPVH